MANVSNYNDGFLSKGVKDYGGKSIAFMRWLKDLASLGNFEGLASTVPNSLPFKPKLRRREEEKNASSTPKHI